jgi:hypothetical protein
MNRRGDVMSTPNTYEPETPVEEIEEVATDVGAAAAGALRVGEVALFVFVGLLICPPLAILAVLVVVPLLTMALALGLIAAIVTAPYLVVHHFRAHDKRHTSLLAHRLRHAGRALFDLLPHRIVAGARKPGHAAR